MIDRKLSLPEFIQVYPDTEDLGWDNTLTPKEWVELLIKLGYNPYQCFLQFLEAENDPEDVNPIAIIIPRPVTNKQWVNIVNLMQPEEVDIPLLSQELRLQWT